MSGIAKRLALIEKHLGAGADEQALRVYLAAFAALMKLRAEGETFTPEEQRAIDAAREHAAAGRGGRSPLAAFVVSMLSRRQDAGEG